MTAYDGNENLTGKTMAMIGAQNFANGYAYEGNDALDVLTYGSGETVTYSPDALGDQRGQASTSLHQWARSKAVFGR